MAQNYVSLYSRLAQEQRARIAGEELSRVGATGRLSRLVANGKSARVTTEGLPRLATEELSRPAKDARPVPEPRV